MSSVNTNDNTVYDSLSDTFVQTCVFAVSHRLTYAPQLTTKLHMEEQKKGDVHLTYSSNTISSWYALE
jgi:hypothetical protein